MVELCEPPPEDEYAVGQIWDCSTVLVVRDNCKNTSKRKGQLCQRLLDRRRFRLVPLSLQGFMNNCLKLQYDLSGLIVDPHGRYMQVCKLHLEASAGVRFELQVMRGVQGCSHAGASALWSRLLGRPEVQHCVPARRCRPRRSTPPPS